MATLSMQPKNTLWKVLMPILLLLVPVVAGLYLIKVQFSHAPRIEGHIDIQVGNTLPDFELTSIEGISTRISDIKSKLFLVNFWATWCDACMDEMPSIVQLRTAFKDRGFEILGINLDENPTMVVPKSIKEYKIEFPVFIDPDGKIAELFDVHAIPLTVILDDRRRIIFVKDGGQNWNTPAIHSQIMRWLSG